jgi:cell shape-determining protein MreC
MIPKFVAMGHSKLAGRKDQIKSELGRLFNEQAAFFKKGNRAAHNNTENNTEIAEYEKRRERIRELFAELDELSKAT